MDALLASHISVVPGWLWASFSVGVVILIFLDLFIFGRSGKITTKKALLESALWIMVALAFNYWFAMEYGKDLGLQFLTGYLVEKSLSVDNLFVILLIFSSFKIPEQFQHRILFYGILGAVVLRGFFIIIGAQLINSFHWILYVFGAFLVVTALKLIFGKEDDENDATNGFAARMFKKFFKTTDDRSSGHFFVKENGVRVATPLFMALVVIEFTDLVFAVDSIPAVFAVTQDGFVAFASNILAVLGLRALYFVLSDWVSKLRYLKAGLAGILGFIGVKMLIMDIYHIPSTISLSVISSILFIAAVASWWVAKKEEQQTK